MKDDMEDFRHDMHQLKKEMRNMERNIKRELKGKKNTIKADTVAEIIADTVQVRVIKKNGVKFEVKRKTEATGDRKAKTTAGNTADSMKVK